MARAKVSLSSLLDREELPAEIAAEPPMASAPKRAAAAPAKAPAEVAEIPAAPDEGDRALSVVADQPLDLEPDVEPSTDPATEVVTAGPEPTAAKEPSPAAQRPVRPVDQPKSNARSSHTTVRVIKAAPEPPPLPLYLELTRKEARFRQDQLNDLTTLTRQLNRRRASTGERITDNTLIRVAVDLLLKVSDSLDGITEADLLQAVSSRLR